MHTIHKNYGEKVRQERKIRLLILVKNYDGGTGTFVESMIQHFNNQENIKVRALLIQKPQYKSKYTGIDDVFSSKIHQHYSVRVLGNVVGKELFWLQNQINYFSPSIILTVDTHCIILVEILRWWNRNKFQTIHTIHNNLRSVFHKKISYLGRILLIPLLRWLLNRSTRVVCVSRELAGDVKNYLHLKSEPICIYNGVVLRHKSSNDLRLQKLHKEENRFSLLTVCRFDQQKDVQTLIRALAILYTENKLFLNLDIVGSGPLKSHIVSMIHQFNLDSNIRIIRWNNNIDSYYQKADVFILSSHYEGLSYVLLEAMNNGLPVISSDCDFGPREILENGKYGILFDPGDEKQLANILNQVLSRSEELNKLQRLSLRRIKSFTLYKQLQEYTKLIENTYR